jgi:membrane protease YdiL (CAAX protease family)
MFKRRHTLRLALTLAYALVAFIYLNLLYAGDTFCGDAHRPSILLATLRFTILATTLDFLASLLGGLVSRKNKASGGLKWAGTALTTLAVGMTLYYARDLLFEGYGIFRFEGTIADVSCLITEGYGLVYPLTIVSAFVILTFVREILFRSLCRTLPDH